MDQGTVSNILHVQTDNGVANKFDVTGWRYVRYASDGGLEVSNDMEMWTRVSPVASVVVEVPT